jgi:hypothetical protein
MNTSDKTFYGLKRLVFREVMPGDRLKVIAKSNKSKSGGGARDLRFSKMEKMLPILEKLFPRVEQRERRRGGVRGPADVWVTDLHWVDERGSVRSEEVALELPTDKRGGEPRIATVHRYESFSDVPPETEGQAVTILAQDAEGRVWPFTASEASLRGHKNQAESWDPDVANYILEALKEKKRKTEAAIGYIDYEPRDRFHN